MNNDTQRQLGSLAAKVSNLEGDVSEIKSDIKDISDTLAQAKGGWKTLLLVAGIAGVMGAMVSKLAMFATWLPR